MNKRDQYIDGGLDVLLESILNGGDTSQAILNQEKRGQMQQATSETLPRECPREALEKLGFVFGEDVDDLFVRVTFPEGWKKVPTDHSMWTHLTDDKGRKRGDIFYKAAFYDRSAHMSLDSRFSITDEPINGYDSPTYREEPSNAVVKDCGEIIWRSEPLAQIEPSGDYSAHYEAKKALRKQAAEWLDERYPDWQDVTAYWD